VIVTYDLPLTFAAKAATKTILIVFVIGADSVKVGLIESLNRPSGNLTGVSLFFSALGRKHAELLHELLPAVSTIALLGNRNNANFETVIPETRAATDATGHPTSVEEFWI
jgi:putative ABC transport system substrate-binding protein